jgi:superfamily II DNA or RNA helicase
LTTLLVADLVESELGVVIAPTGAGKSMVLVHLGAQAIKEGKTVIHYTLELAGYSDCKSGMIAALQAIL